MRMTEAVVCVLIAASTVWAAADERTTVRRVFLDNGDQIVDGSMSYDPETRTCGQGRDLVFTTLDGAAQALVDSDVLFLRSGTYTRESVGSYHRVHGNRVNYWTGSLSLEASGTPKKRKVVSAYPGEKVIIQARPGMSRYNPEPGDKRFAKSSHYYPHPAVSISGAHLLVRGIKTYGQVVINGHHITLEQCDLGGGGPHMNQGQVVALNSNREGGVHHVVLRDNKIHHSCWGESRGNGAALMCYNASFVAEHNEFYDNFGADIRIKDTGGQEGRDIVIQHNFFASTSIHPSGNVGVGGHNQDVGVDHIDIRHNVFHNKSTGISFAGPARHGTVAYNNTFVDCGNGSGDIGDWTNPQINLFNNLYYHSQKGQKFYDLQCKPWSRLASDHNLFFSTTTETSWHHLYRRRATTLDRWRDYSGKDQHSVWKDPDFVKASGSRPEHFKRKDPSPDVTGSRYGNRCGAYVTGKEQIGVRPIRN